MNTIALGWLGGVFADLFKRKWKRSPEPKLSPEEAKVLKYLAEKGSNDPKEHGATIANKVRLNVWLVYQSLRRLNTLNMVQKEEDPHEINWEEIVRIFWVVTQIGKRVAATIEIKD